MKDDVGYWPKWLTKVAIGTAVIAAAAVLTVATAGTGTALACFAVGAVKGAAVGAASGAVSGAITSNACFVAGTQVLTEFGNVAIETVKQGDLVWAGNPETAEIALKQVVRTFRNESCELIHVCTEEEEILTTPGHPFYVKMKGWVRAGELCIGDRLSRRNGGNVVVSQVWKEKLDEAIIVYNFEVADFHTYYVGQQMFLVHNMCQPRNMAPNGTGRKGAFRAAKKEIGVPRSQQPVQILKNIDKKGKVVPGRVYDFGGGKFIRDDVIGHIFSDGSRIERHFNTPNKLHFFY